MTMTKGFNNSSTFRNTLLSNNDKSNTMRFSKSATNTNFMKGKFHRRYTRTEADGKIRLLSPVASGKNKYENKEIETAAMLRQSQ